MLSTGIATGYGSTLSPSKWDISFNQGAVHNMRDCPECGRSGLKDWSTVCRYCHQEIPVAGQESPAGVAKSPKDLTKLSYCDHCGFVGRPKRYTKGSFGIEILLYFLMIFPGLLYTVWRLTSKFSGCPKCATPNMMPATSPKARAAISAQT
jgi:hypothetical protein